jgi:hypothetical protein
VLSEEARGLGMAYYQKLPRTEFDGEDLWTVQRAYDGDINLILQPSRVTEVDDILRLKNLEGQLAKAASKKREATRQLREMHVQPDSIQKTQTVFIKQMEDMQDEANVQIAELEQRITEARKTERVDEIVFTFPSDLGA